MIDCTDCHTTHMGFSNCGLTYVQRLRSAQLHPDATPSREKKKYWDQQALNDQFGEDARERSLSLTEGRGFNGPTNPQDVAKLFD